MGRKGDKQGSVTCIHGGEVINEMRKGGQSGAVQGSDGENMCLAWEAHLGAQSGRA